MKDFCSYCGTTYEDILDSGMVGCEHCYTDNEKLRLAVVSMFDGRVHHGRKVRD